MTKLSLTNIFLRVGILFTIYTIWGAGANYPIYGVNLAPLHENSKLSRGITLCVKIFVIFIFCSVLVIQKTRLSGINFNQHLSIWLLV